MFRQLVLNTLFTGTAFLLSGLLSLIIIPVIINAYGLTAFGLIVLARVFLPAGFMAMFDFGISETATQAVARARARAAWPGASQQVTLLLTGAIVIGAIVGAALMIAGLHAPALFRVAAAQQASFGTIIQVTGLSLIILYPGLLLEGVIKGFERYALLRMLEVLGTLTYVLATFWVVRSGLPYDAVAYAFLAATVLKYLALAVCAIPLLKSFPLRLARWDKANRVEVMHRSLLMFQSKILGAFQGQSPPLFIGALVGPAGVAVYDVLVRLPRFAKGLLGLLTSALLPVAARLDESSDHERMQQLGKTGFWLLPAAAFPILMAAALFAEDLLREWLGPGLTRYWPWLSLMFIVPLLSILLSFGQTMMQVRIKFLAVTNRLALWQVTLQFAISLALVGLLQERAFIVGQVAALLLVFPVQMWLLLNQQGLKVGLLLESMGKQALVALPLMALGALARHYWPIDGLPSLAVAAGLWCGAYWACIYALVLSAPERLQVRKIIVTGLGR